MADDFDDLFARTSPSRSTAYPSFGTSPSASAATSPTLTSRTGPSAGAGAASFGAFGEDDFGVSSNPFADMQSSTIYHAHQQDEAAAAVSSPPRSIERTESQQGQPERPESVEIAANDNIQEDQQPASEIHQESDSPFIEDPGASTIVSTSSHVQAEPSDLFGSTDIEGLHGFADPFPTSPAKPALRVDDLEDDPGFRDPPDSSSSEAFSSRRTSVSASDSQPSSRNGYEGNDAASVRTVGLDSDVASLRSTNVSEDPYSHCHEH